jgi:hypothetical protein
MFSYVSVNFKLYVSRYHVMMVYTVRGKYVSILGAFTKLRKATIGLVLSGRLSFCLEQLGSHVMDSHES